jgi:Domain of unknown function (DUF4112)
MGDGEVVGRSRTEQFRAAERRIARISHVLDNLFGVPGTGRRVGLDPLVGLIPFVGDVISAAAGAYLIAEASRFRLPPVVLARMVVNLLVDLAIGLIPFLGDLFDFVSKSNAKNLALFRRYALEPEASTAEHRLFFAGIGLVMLGLIWLVWQAVAWVIGLLLTPIRL